MEPLMTGLFMELVPDRGVVLLLLLLLLLGAEFGTCVQELAGLLFGGTCVPAPELQTCPEW